MRWYLVSLRFCSQTIKDKNAAVFIFENTGQAKSVWRAAVDMHIRYRLEVSEALKPGFDFKMTRPMAKLGKKQVKIKVVSNDRNVRRPQLAAIAEASPIGTPRRRSLLQNSKDKSEESVTKPKEVAIATRHETVSTKSEPTLKKHTEPKVPVSPARSQSSKKGMISVNPVPKPSPNLEKLDPASDPANVTIVKENENASTLRYDDKVASAIPAHVRSSIISSKASSTDGSSVVTDDTDVLCSSSVVEKAFSYTEKDGTNSINAWLELCTPREEQSRGRPAIRSAPGSKRAKSRDR